MRFLSQCIGRPVRDPSGEPIGKVADLIVAIGDRYPPVTGLVVAHRPAAHLPALDGRRTLRRRRRQLHAARSTSTSSSQRPNEILLAADLQDKQIVDIDGRKVVRVNDLRLDEIEGRLHLVAVDVGAAGLLRRLGIEGPFRTVARNLRLPRPRALHRLGGRRPGRDLDRVASACACRTPASPSCTRPTSPTIIDQLAPRDRAGVLASLDDEAARRCDRGDGARDAGRGARGPRARARGGHPRGDEPRRRGRPRRRPLGPAARRDPRAHGAGRGGGGQRAARLPRGLGRRHHDHRVHRRAGDAHGGRGHRPAARARARRGDDLLRLRDRRRGRSSACCRCAT